MADDKVSILSQGIVDEKTRVAVRQVERLLQSTLSRITSVEGSVTASVTGVSSVTGLGSINTSPTTGDVVVSIGAIDESQVTGLVDDLAGKVPVTRLIGTTAPLFGGGDLSTDRTLSILADGIDDTLLRNSSATSVIGRSANSVGDPADIVASSDGDVLRRTAGVLGFGTIPATSITGLPTVSGTVNTVAKFTGTNAIGDSTITASGTNITLGANALTTGQHVIEGITYMGGLTHGRVYVPTAAELNFHYLANSEQTGNINLHGFSAGSTQFRNLVIGDGKGSSVVTFTGSSKLAAFAGSVTVDGNLSTTNSANSITSAGKLMSYSGSTYMGNATLNFYFTGNSEQTGLINYTGYNAGFTQYRNLGIYDGKGNQVALFTGSSKSTTLAGNLTTNGTLDTFCNGSAYFAAGRQLNFDSANNSATDGAINWTGYAGGTTQFRDLGIYDGKNGTIAYFRGATKSTFLPGYLGIGTADDSNYQLLIESGRHETLRAQSSPSAEATNDLVAVNGIAQGTYNTTSANRIAYGTRGVSIATRSSGSNSLYDVGLYGYAAGGQINWGLWVDSGTAQIDEDLYVGGNTTLGAASTNTTTVNGDLRVTDAGSSGYLRLTSSSGANYIQSGTTLSSDSKAPLYFSSMFAGSVYGGFDSAGGFFLNNRATITAGVGTAFGNVDANGNLILEDSTAMDTGVGGGILFRGKYTTAGDYAGGAGIKLMKSSATDGDYSFDLVFGARQYGDSAPIESMRLNADGSALFSGAVTVEGDTTLQEKVIANGVTTEHNIPPLSLPLSGTINDWNPNSTWSDGDSIIDADSNSPGEAGDPIIHGLVGGTVGRRCFLYWNGGSGTLMHDSSTATAGNRFWFKDGADRAVSAETSIYFIYYNNHWREV